MRAKPGHQSLLLDVENHYGLLGCSSYADHITINIPSPAWRAASEIGRDGGAYRPPGGKQKASDNAAHQPGSSNPSEVLPSWEDHPAAGGQRQASKQDRQQRGGKAPSEEKPSYFAVAASKARSPKDAPAGNGPGASSSMSREATATIIAHDLCWKLQMVVAEACSAFVDLHAIAAARGSDIIAALRSASSDDSSDSGTEAGSIVGASGEAVAAMGSRELLERLQLIRDMIVMNREALFLSRAPNRVADAISQETRRLASTTGPKKLTQQQQLGGNAKGAHHVFSSTWASDEAHGRLQKCRRSLWALLLTCSSWGPCPPADLCGGVEALLTKRQLESAAITDVLDSMSKSKKHLLTP